MGSDWGHWEEARAQDTGLPLCRAPGLPLSGKPASSQRWAAGLEEGGRHRGSPLVYPQSLCSPPSPPHPPSTLQSRVHCLAQTELVASPLALWRPAEARQGVGRGRLKGHALLAVAGGGGKQRAGPEDPVRAKASCSADARLGSREPSVGMGRAQNKG